MSEQLNLATTMHTEGLPSVRERIAGLAEGYSQWAEQYPFAATTIETVVAFAAKRAVIWAGDKTGINFGNAHAHHFVDRGVDHPLAAAAALTVAAPVKEEVFYRYLLTDKLPNSSVMQDKFGDKAQRICDIVSSAGFAALGHGFDPIKPRAEWNNPDGGLTSKGNRQRTISPLNRWQWALPLGSAVGGEQYRRIYQKRGLGHSIGSHALNNALTVLWEGGMAARDLKRENPRAKLSVKSILKHAQKRKAS